MIVFGISTRTDAAKITVHVNGTIDAHIVAHGTVMVSTLAKRGWANRVMIRHQLRGTSLTPGHHKITRANTQ